MLRKFYGKISIKAKLIIISIILLAYPMVIIGYFGYQSVTNILKDKSFNYSKATVDELSSLFSDRIEKLSSYSFQILYDNRIYEASSIIQQNTADSFWENEFQRYLASVLYSKLEFSELLVYFTRSGKVYQESRAHLAVTDCYNILTRLQSEAWKGKGKPVWYIDHEGDNVKGIYLIKTVYDVNSINNEIALLAFKIDRDQLFKILNDFSLYIKQNISIISGDNVEIYKYLVFKENYQRPWGEYLSPNSNYSEIRTNNDKIYFIYNTIGASDWKMVIRISSNELLKEVRRESSIILLLCLATLPLFLILINYLYIDLIRPMNLLIKKMLQIEKGNTGVTIDSNRSDELGYVYRTFNKMSSEIHNLINRVYKVQIAMKDSEIKALQAQINPHFLYNTLETINWKAKMHGVEEISEMVSALSSIIEANLNRKGENLISLKKEIAYVNNYNLLIQKRFGRKIKFTMNIQEDVLDCKIPKLVIQPLIENSVYHGLETKKGGGTVDLTIYRESENLVIKVSDDGTGIEEYTLENLRTSLKECLSMDIETKGKDNSKIGIINVHKRIQLLYGESYGLEIDSRYGEGTIITIKLPA